MDRQKKAKTLATPRPKPQILEISTVLIGELNGDEIRLEGTGTINEAEGLNQGIFEIQKLPDYIDAQALGPFLFTGYPNSCRTAQSGVANPFSGGSYTYKRHYRFATSDNLAILEVTCNLDSEQKKLTSVFCLKGSMPRLGPVSAVSPIYELWSLHGDKLTGIFGVSWLNAPNGSIIETATATSDYNPVHSSALGRQPKHRFLKLDSKLKSPNLLFVTQTSHIVA